MLGSGLIAWAAARLLGYNPHAFIPPMVFTNSANMGLPLFAFGAQMPPAAVALFMVSHSVHFTIGIRICAPHASLRGILKGSDAVGDAVWRIDEPARLVAARLAGDEHPHARLNGHSALGCITPGVGFSGFRVERWSIGIVGAFLCLISGLLVAWPLVKLLPLTQPMQALLLLYWPCRRR